MPKLVLLFSYGLAALALMVSCGPSEENIQATVDAKVSQAIAAIPTVTPQPTATSITFPSPVPTVTPQPTATSVTFPTPLPTSTPIVLLPTSTPQPTSTPFILPTPQLTVSSAVQVASPATVVILGTQAQGSGVVYRHDGYILTNQHVVGDDKTVRVRVPNGSSQITITGAVIGSNEIKDLAVIHVQRTGMAFAVMGNSSLVQIGEEVVALGYPLGQTGSVTVTRGVLSRRTIHSSTGELLQTDAAINPGNSGGPLVNLKGEVIGINQSIRINPSTGEIAQGIGFTIAINDVKLQLPQLEAGTFVKASNTKYTNIDRGYFFEYPSHWQINSSSVDNITVFKGNSSFSTLTFVNTAGALSDPFAIRQFILNEEANSLTSIVVANSDTVSIRFQNGASLNSMVLNYSGTQAGRDLTLRSIGFRFGATVYWLRFSADSSDFDDVLTIFGEIYTSWEFIN